MSIVLIVLVVAALGWLALGCPARPSRTVDFDRVRQLGELRAMAGAPADVEHLRPRTRH